MSIRSLSSRLVSSLRGMLICSSGQPALRIEHSRPKAEVNSLDVSFLNAGGELTRVLQDINLEIQNGEFVSIVGPSGCGKSTLLRVLSGLVTPTSGAVFVDGNVVRETPKGVGFMFQRDTLLPWATVAENIAIGADLSKRPGNQGSERIRELISFLRLTGFEQHRPHQISGGMRQRVALGRLLAYEPDLYLMDEPFGALDSQTKQIMGAELLRVWAAHRRSVVFISHDIEEAVSLSDRVIVLTQRPGRIKLDLTIDLPRPRDIRHIKTSKRFGELCDAVWDNLELQD